jgi:hypothetical protein
MAYNDTIRKQILDLLQLFFNETKGNRLTTFSMNGLIGDFFRILDANQVSDANKNPTDMALPKKKETINGPSV